MTYSKLLELIEAMSDEQKDMEVIINVPGCEDAYLVISMVSEIAYADQPEDPEAEAYEVGQPILS